VSGVNILAHLGRFAATSNFSLGGEVSVKDSQTNIDVKEIKVLDPWWITGFCNAESSPPQGAGSTAEAGLAEFFYVYL